MKRSYLTFAVAFLVLATVVLWLPNSEYNASFVEYVQLGIIFVLIAFAIFFGVRRLKSEKRGQPVEDELSKKIMMKASSFSYFISIYLWLVIMYISDKVKIELDVLLGCGILGMTVILAVSWVVISMVGLKSE